MFNIRPPAVAGTFYPANSGDLRVQVDGFLAAAGEAPWTPKAIVAPHAGYIFSGPIAASAYASLSKLRSLVNRVVLLGPAHRVYIQGIAASSAEGFASPLGDVPIDREAMDRVVEKFSFVSYADAVHAPEHSLEVQLPFLQTSLDQFSLVPLAVGDAEPAQVESVLEELWDGPETLIVISSDLSHYHDYATAMELDRATSDAIERLDPDAIRQDQACGRIPVCGLMRVARNKGLLARTLDLRNSGDTGGPRDQVVGYGAYIFYGA